MQRRKNNNVLCSLAQAGSDTFACIVTSAHVASEEGEIVTNTDFLKGQVGLTLSVDRESGVIRGDGNLNNTGMKSIQVVNEPKDAECYVVSINYHPEVYYLYIANQRKWKKKPFTYALHGEYVYSGYCQ